VLEKTFRPTKTREIELDFVRGIAILCVVDFHSPYHLLFRPLLLLGFPHFGWFGVDLFFVLSGFLVGGLLIKEWKLQGRIDGRRFLIRRGLKIWPLYYVFLVAMLFTVHRHIPGLWSNFLNIQNYVGGIGFTWSLAVEEHAYLLLILCFGIAARYRVRMRTIFFLMGAVAAGVVLLRFYEASQHWKSLYIRTHTRIDGILYGVMLAILYHYAPESFRRLQSQLWLWWGGILVSLLYLRFTPQPMWVTALQVDAANLLSISMLMLLYRHRQEGRKRLWPYRMIAWIGLYSYGIYMWNIFGIGVVASRGPHLPVVLSTLWEMLVPPGLAITLGIVATKLVEFPVLKLRDKFFPRRVDSAVGVPAEIEAERLHEQGV